MRTSRSDLLALLVQAQKDRVIFEQAAASADALSHRWKEVAHKALAKAGARERAEDEIRKEERLRVATWLNLLVECARNEREREVLSTLRKAIEAGWLSARYLPDNIVSREEDGDAQSSSSG